MNEIVFSHASQGEVKNASQDRVSQEKGKRLGGASAMRDEGIANGDDFGEVVNDEESANDLVVGAGILILVAHVLSDPHSECGFQLFPTQSRELGHDPVALIRKSIARPNCYCARPELTH